MRIFLTMAALAVLACPALAADEKGSFAVDGIGAQSCDDLTKAAAAKNEVYFAFAGWTGGFMTAVNVFREDTFDITPFQPTDLIMAKMVQYCTANPTESYVNALGKLVATLMPARLTAASELVRVEVDGKAIFVYASVLDDLRKKVMPGAAPGTGFTKEFAKAIGMYQTANGLSVTGLPDLATMNHLYP